MNKTLVDFEPQIKRLFKKGITNLTKLHRELKKSGFRKSYITLYRYLKDVSYSNLIREYRPARRFETKPGEQAQVDWGSFGKIEVNGRIERLYCFVYLLGYSRAMYIEFTIKQNLQTLQNCHIHAFEKLGIPQTVVYDNMKTVVLNREKMPNGTKKPKFNPGFLDFAQHYGFRIKLCPPYWPRAKGKVESGIRYVRSSFMQGMRFGKDFYSVDQLNQKAVEWLTTEANVRIHRTIEQRPIELWKKEKTFLHFPDLFPAYETTPFVERRVTKDGLVQHKLNFYSIPIKYAQKRIFLKEKSENDSSLIEIYFQDKLIAEHILSHERGRLIINEDHLKISKRIKYKKTNKQIKNQDRDHLNQEDFHRPLSYYEFLI